MGDKTLPPTQRRLQKARRDGKVTISQDVTRFILFGGVFEFICVSGALWYGKLSGFLMKAITAVTASQTVRMSAAWSVGSDAAVLAITLAGLSALLAIAATWPQSRFIVSTKALSHGVEKLNPAGGLKQLLGTEKIFMGAISLLKVTILVAVLYPKARDYVPSILQLSRFPLNTSALGVAQILRSTAHIALFIFLLFSVVDYYIQRLMFRRQLKMDHQDMKDEYKESEGDPHAKGYMRSIRKQFANEQPSNVSRQPNVVAVNPQRIAVGLCYEEGRDSLPIIVVRGAGRRADEIRKWARENQVPMIRYVKLARILYAVGREGQYVPTATVKAVAVLYKALIELRASGDRFVDDRVYLPEVDPRLGDQVLPGLPLE
ncbi:flagellar biosynthesis protein FlhB [Burkholderia cepacia]|uniref:EscU/YscU/HrcU family type III secretion system export apparatus switch protein n=1 Tax=Burkholderia cepacia TaxID=292 RepID=UPI0009BD1429|nr:EscU/YscU/HrcU family type III secretion system export apparatus switch protein [Burkholderia cepacia]